MTRLIVILLPLILTGCAALYPIGGAVLGGAAGSPFGIGGAALGAGAGAAGGALLAGDKELKDAKEEIKLLSTGDVNALVQKRLEEAKDGGFFDSIMEEVYGFVKLALIGLVLWNVVPIIYTRYVHKKAGNGSPEKTKK